MRALALLSILLTAQTLTVAAEWQPKQAPLMTKWAKDVKPENPLPEYPRPQMVREQWQNLNGLWEYAIRPKAEGQPDKWDGQILVPFPVESALSGVMKLVGPDNRLWYGRTFSLPKYDGKVIPAWTDKNILLHFGAVDWETTVWLNGKEVGSHKGGYDPFTFDVTAALKNDGPNELVVSVWDGSDDGYQPRGKQVRKPEGIWYTPTTGIWQTVWLEPVPELSIAGIIIETDMTDSRTMLKIEAKHRGEWKDCQVRVQIGELGSECMVGVTQAGSTKLASIASSIGTHGANDPLVLIATILVAVGFSFKLAAVP